MRDHPRRPPLLDRHLERGQHQRRPQMRGHGPAHDAPTPDIEHDRQIQDPRPDRDVGDSGHPQLIRLRGRELAPHQIRGRLSPGRPHRRPRSFAPADALQARRRIRRATRLRPTWTPRGLMDGPDAREQRRVPDGARTLGTGAPRLVPAGGDTQHPAHGGNRVGGLMRLHDFEDPDGIDPVSRANQAAAFSRSPVPHAALHSRGGGVELRPFIGRQPVGAPTGIAIGLADPLTDGMGRRLELLCQRARQAARPHQLNQLLAELRRIWWSRFRHRRLLSPMRVMCPRNRGNFTVVVSMPSAGSAWRVPPVAQPSVHRGTSPRSAPG